MPLEKHADVVHKCARELVGFFGSIPDKDWDAAKASQEKVASLENKADDIKKEIDQCQKS